MTELIKNRTKENKKHPTSMKLTVTKMQKTARGFQINKNGDGGI